MTIQQILNEEKYIIDVPQSIIIKLDKIISNKKITEKQKKAIIEIKGIIVGKYPNELAIKNSLKGLNKKVDLLTERVSVFRSLVLSLAVLISSITIPRGIENGIKNFENYYRNTNDKTTTAISNKVNASKAISKMLVVEVDEKVWNKIEVILDKIEEEINNGNTIDGAYETVRKDLADNKIDLVNKPDNEFAGFYSSKTKRLELNVDNKMNKEARKYTDVKDQTLRDDAWIKELSKQVKNNNLAILKHELTHKTQIEKLNPVIRKLAELRYFLNDGAVYDAHVFELGAYYAQIKEHIRAKEEYRTANIKPQILRNIIKVYPEDDAVIRTIKAFSPNVEEVNPTVNLSEKQAQKIRNYLQKLQENKNAIKEAKGN